MSKSGLEQTQADSGPDSEDGEDAIRCGTLKGGLGFAHGDVRRYWRPKSLVITKTLMKSAILDRTSVVLD